MAEPTPQPGRAKDNRPPVNWWGFRQDVTSPGRNGGTVPFVQSVFCRPEGDSSRRYLPVPHVETRGFDRPSLSGLRVAVCQIRCVDGDREGNLARIAAAVKQAAQQQAAVACFPETALLGSALLAVIPCESFDSLDVAFDHYRDHRGQAWRLVPNARSFPECPQPVNRPGRTATL